MTNNPLIFEVFESTVYSLSLINEGGDDLGQLPPFTLSDFVGELPQLEDWILVCCKAVVPRLQKDGKTVQAIHYVATVVEFKPGRMRTTRTALGELSAADLGSDDWGLLATRIADTITDMKGDWIQKGVIEQ